MRIPAVALAVASFLGVVAVAVSVGLRPESRLREPVRQKTYSRFIAEGVRYRDFQNFGVDCLSFKSCRVEKRRKGGMIFGAFNVLVVDGLTLNIPAGSPVAEKEEAMRGTPVDEIARTFLRSQGLDKIRFSGVQINGLAVSRCASNGVERVFSAAWAENGIGREGLSLHDCEVYASDGSGIRVGQARLVFQPEMFLTYTENGAERRIVLGRF